MPHERPHKKRAARSHGGRPTREDSERKIAQLLDCAAEMFAREGYARTSMAALAEAAGVGKPTIYARFESKSNLFSMVVEHILNHHLVAVESVQASDAKEALRKQLSSILSASLEPMFLGLFRLFLAEAHKFPEILAAFTVSSEGSIRLLTPHLTRIGEETPLRLPVRDICDMLLAMLNKVVMLETVQPDRNRRIDADAEAARIVDALLHGVLEVEARGAPRAEDTAAAVTSSGSPRRSRAPSRA